MSDVLHEMTRYAMRHKEPYGRWVDEMSALRDKVAMLTAALETAMNWDEASAPLIQRENERLREQNAALVSSLARFAATIRENAKNRELSKGCPGQYWRGYIDGMADGSIRAAAEIDQLISRTESAEGEK